MRQSQAHGQRVCKIRYNAVVLHRLLQEVLYAEVRIWVDASFEDVFPPASLQLPHSHIDVPEDIVEIAFPGAIAQFVASGFAVLVRKEEVSTTLDTVNYLMLCSVKSSEAFVLAAQEESVYTMYVYLAPSPCFVFSACIIDNSSMSCSFRDLAESYTAISKTVVV